MCLNRIYKRNYGWRSGYKVFFVQNDGTIYNACRGNDNIPCGYQFGKWYKANKTMVPTTNICCPFKQYVSGFHVYKNKKSALKHAGYSNDCRGFGEYIVVDVECEEPSAFGFQEYGAFSGRHSVGVFGKIRLVKEVKQ